MLLRIELYVVLYLLAGVIYYLLVKHVVDEVLGERNDPTVKAVAIGLFIIVWPYVLLLDTIGYLRYWGRRIRAFVQYLKERK